jgi:hypothetical protein
MEQTDARAQANLLDDQPWTCFIGAWNPTGPKCGALTEEQVLDPNPSCNCTYSWRHQILPHFSGNDTKRVMSLVPEPELLTNSTQTFLNLQVEFNCKYYWPTCDEYITYPDHQLTSSPPSDNSSVSLVLGSPNLWLFVYDPVVSAEEAYFKGYALITLMNANGVTTVTLNLNYYEKRNVVPHYEYGLLFLLSRETCALILLNNRCLSIHEPWPQSHLRCCWRSECLCALYVLYPSTYP